jgi:CBS-domain-containing membrane protein
MMRACEIMTQSVVTVRAETEIQHAAQLLAEHGITSLPVLDDDHGLIGIVSEVDLIRDRMPRDPRSHLRPDTSEQPDPARLVRDVMSADTADVAALMLEHNVRAVPIVDGAKVVGIISRRDLLRTLIRDDAAIAADVDRRLDDYAGERGRWAVEAENGIVTIRGRFDDEAQERVVSVLARTVPGAIRVHAHPHR